MRSVARIPRFGANARKSVIRVVGVAAAAVVVAGFATPANAATTGAPNPASHGAPSKTGLSQPGAHPNLVIGVGGGVTCTGITYQPFNDSAGYAYGDGETYCSSVVSELGIAQTLYRLRWYGWQSLNSDSSDVAASNDAWTSTWWNCSGVGTYTYEADSSHYAYTPAGEVSGDTSNQARFGC